MMLVGNEGGHFLWKGRCFLLLLLLQGDFGGNRRLARVFVPRSCLSFSLTREEKWPATSPC